MIGGDWMQAMRDGEFARAWALSDAVLAARDPATRDDPTQPYHLRWVWDGRSWLGREVLVRCYHGLGDTLNFVRLLPLLRHEAAAITLEVQPELAGLLRHAPGADRVVPFDVAHPMPPAECDIEIMELPHALRIDRETIPSAPAYPTASQGAIGLCWQAGNWDPARSITAARLVEACAVPGMRLFSLQRGPAAEAATVAFANRLDRSMDVEDTAALIRTLDLVVSVDTMVAHLAGMLGTPTLLLLHAEPDWRWMRDTDRSPWYASMRLLRQRRPGDWSEPLAELRRLLG